MKTTGERIKEARLAAGMTQTELADKIGVKFSAIHKYESGMVKNMKQDTIAKLSEALGVKPSYLMGYTDATADELAVPPQAMIPVLGRVSAGIGVIADEDIIGYESTDAKYDNGEYFYLQVKGDSMSPKIDDGDLVLVHRQTSVDSGTVGVFSVDGEDGFVKKVEYDAENIDLISFNPYYPPMHFHGPDVLRVYVHGRVVKLERRF